MVLKYIIMSNYLAPATSPGKTRCSPEDWLLTMSTYSEKFRSFGLVSVCWLVCFDLVWFVVAAAVFIRIPCVAVKFWSHTGQSLKFYSVIKWRHGFIVLESLYKISRPQNWPHKSLWTTVVNKWLSEAKSAKTQAKIESGQVMHKPMWGVFLWHCFNVL